MAFNTFEAQKSLYGVTEGHIWDFGVAKIVKYWLDCVRKSATASQLQSFEKQLRHLLAAETFDHKTARQAMIIYTLSHAGPRGVVREALQHAGIINARLPSQALAALDAQNGLVIIETSRALGQKILTIPPLDLPRQTFQYFVRQKQ